MFHVYLLRSLKDHNYYIGYSDNVENRLKHHNKSKVKSTKSRIPFELVGYETYKTGNEARWREYNLKRNTNERKKFIKKLTDNANDKRGG